MRTQKTPQRLTIKQLWNYTKNLRLQTRCSGCFRRLVTSPGAAFVVPMELASFETATHHGPRLRPRAEREPARREPGSKPTEYAQPGCRASEDKGHAGRSRRRRQGKAAAGRGDETAGATILEFRTVQLQRIFDNRPAQEAVQVAGMSPGWGRPQGPTGWGLPAIRQEGMPSAGNKQSSRAVATAPGTTRPTVRPR